MRLKIILITTLLSLPASAFGQNIYFKTGLNLTNYQFMDREGNKAEGLNSASGSSYEIGLSIPLRNEWLKYELGIALDAYNASGGDVNNNYTWETNYGGIKNTISFTQNVGEFDLGFYALGLLSTMINGAQVINNSRHDLINHPDFKGILLQKGAGLSASYKIIRNGLISLQYDFTKSFKIGEKPAEKLTFLNNRILFGIHIDLN